MPRHKCKFPFSYSPDHVPRLSVEDIARRWNISVRRVRKMCQDRKIFSARKVEGVWTIPETADRPPDGRSYRYRRVPEGLENVVRHADVALRDAHGRRSIFTPENRLAFFLVGSAYHLHKLQCSGLKLRDVREVIDGRGVAGKKLSDQLAVFWHVNAIRYVMKAVRRRRRLSVRLVEEFYSMLLCGSPEGRVHYRGGLDKDVRTSERRLRVLVERMTGSEMHPIVQAGIFINQFVLDSPFESENERVAYLVANFMLMKGGYPPIVIYRALFNAERKYRRRRKELVEEDEEPSDLGLDFPSRLFPPLNDGRFFTAVVARAVRWSCKMNLHLILEVRA